MFFKINRKKSSVETHHFQVVVTFILKALLAVVRRKSKRSTSAWVTEACVCVSLKGPFVGSWLW